MSILDKGMLKCALTITDTIRNIGRTQNSYSLCDLEKRTLKGLEVIVSVSLGSLEAVVSNRRV